MSVRSKLLGSFFVVIALMVVITAISVAQMNRQEGTLNKVQTNWMPSIGKLVALQRNFTESRVALHKVLLETEREQVEHYAAQFNTTSDAFAAGLKAYEGLVSSPEEKTMYTDIMKQSAVYFTGGQSIIEAAKAGDRQAGKNKLDSLTPVRSQVDSGLDRWIDYNFKGAQKDVDTSATQNGTARLLTVLLTAAAVLGAIGLALLLSTSFIRAVRSIGEAVASASEGDLRTRADVTGRDELGALAGSFNQMLEQWRKLIGHTLETSQNVAAAAEQISATAQEVSAGTVVQAQSAQQLSELVQELNRSFELVAKSAEEAAELSREANRRASDGEDSIRESVRGMEQLSGQVKLLEQDSARIEHIIEVIDEIAEQTNLLALNAAIEAARAGEQGRGFAVVADEVRKLAERCAVATRQIGGIVRGMQDNTKQSVQAVEAAAVVSGKLGQSFSSIVQRVNETAGRVTDIAAACEEQSAQSADVLHSIESIASVSEEAAAASGQTAQSTQTLAGLAEELQGVVRQFKV